MKKPFIRLAIFFMAIATICMSGSCIAVSGETSEKNADTVLYGNTSDNTYYEYADKFAESPLGQQALTVAGGDYASETGSGAVKKSVYEGKSNVLLWDTEKGTVSYAFNLSDAGLYNIIVTYRQVEKRGSDIRLSLKIINSSFADKSRIYLSGSSMGGYTCWNMLIAKPQWFAAAVICCGGGMYFDAERIDIPVIAVHGELDTVVLPRESAIMVEKINSCGGNAKLILHLDLGHDVWTRTFTNKKTYKWLLDKQRQ